MVEYTLNMWVKQRLRPLKKISELVWKSTRDALYIETEPVRVYEQLYTWKEILERKV